ncbi:hypothetical protein sS8_0349 [Methylocaldum marinum]|uniref:Uncharacterized protein n=1 Tax=Methylocaldum marinum TaxID=1432792 RepID=A0A286P3U5_9GAMM|nr:VPLPA-CTERM sorting domain-containing protein [Methylocaldum marinum]BBA32317.1 hypothetical protein sS8_0349 [Methylocaldum marinum]
MKTFTGAMTGLLIFLGGASAHAALLEGQSVYFQFADADLDFFGTPSIEGNTLTFDFSDIYTASPSTPQREVLEFQVVAKSGFQINNFHLSEGGDYSLSGKNSSVAASSRLRLDDFTNDELFRESSEKSFRLGAAGGEKSGSWSAVFDQSITLSEELDVLLTTMLWANPAGPNGEARIDLSSISVTIGSILAGGEPAPVPLPAAVWLLGSGLAGLTGVAARKNQARC